MLYVTNEELAEFLGLDAVGGLPAWAGSMARRASGLVGDAIAAARYVTTPDGLPADERLRNAVRDATATQVEAWVQHGIDPAKGIAQLPKRVAARSALGVSISYEATGAQRELEQLAAGESLTDAAASILWRAGLVSAAVAETGTPSAGVRPYESVPYSPTTGAV